MNETMETIMNRRSTRAFLPVQVKASEMEQILAAGLHAPSAGNQQSWHFTVVQDRAVLDALDRSAKETALKGDNDYLKQLAENPKFQAFYGAPTAVIVSGEEAAMAPQTDCAAATENMLIAAESLGVAGVWVGFVGVAFQGAEAEPNRKRLGIPDGYAPYYAIALGYRKGERGKAPPRKENAVRYV